MVNYLARLGWAHGDDEDVHASTSSSAGSTSRSSRPSPGRFDPEKLKWVNHEHMKRLDADELARRLAPFLAARRDRHRSGPVGRAASRRCCATASPTLADMAEAAHYFYATPHRRSRNARRAGHTPPIARRLIELRRRVRDDRMDARGDRRRDQGRRGAAWPEAAASDDAAAGAGVRERSERRRSTRCSRSSAASDACANDRGSPAG